MLGALCLPLFSAIASAQARFPAEASIAAAGPGGTTWIAGTTSSRTLPTTPGVVQPRAGRESCESPWSSACQDVFVARLSSSGAAERVTYLGGTSSEWIRGLTVGTNGTVYIAVQTSSEKLLGGTYGDSGWVIVALTPDLDRVVRITEIPRDLSNEGLAIHTDGTLRLLDRDGRLWLGTDGGRFTEIGRLNTLGQERASFSFLDVAPDGELFARFRYDRDGEPLVWVLHRLSPDGRTERYRKVTDGFGGFQPVTGGTVWVSSRLPGGGGGIGRVLPNGDTEYLARSGDPLDASLFFPNGPGEMWFAGWTGQPVRTVGNAARHCRVAALEGYVGRLLVTERRIDYLGFVGRSSAESAVWLEPQANGARLLTRTGESTGWVGLSIPAAASGAPYCLDANIYNLALAGGPQGPVDGFCFGGFCGSPQVDPSLLAPGEMIAIPGRGLGPAATVKAPPGALPRVLAGTRLLMDGQPVPLLAVREDRIDAVVPFGAKPGTKVKFTVERDGRATGGTEAAMAEANPEIFRGPGGTGMIRTDGTEVSRESPAKEGEWLTVFLTGAGRLEKDVDEARPLEARLALALPVKAYVATFGYPRTELVVSYAGPVAGQLPGLVQVNFRLPERMAGGSNRLAVFVGEDGFAPVLFEAVGSGLE